MAAPTFVGLSALGVVTGLTTPAQLVVTDTATSGVVVGSFIVVVSVVDGTSSTLTPTTAVTGSYENLAGTDNQLTSLPGNPYNVGSPNAGRLYVWLGRVLTLSGSSVEIRATVASPGDDLYTAMYVFSDVSAGTDLSTVIENSTAGNANSAAATSTTVSDVGVTTLGADRLALNCIGINDDATGLAAFAGESGGDWVLAGTVLESSTGTDATVAVMRAAMASAGTIDGGSDAITSDGWGNVGFALIGTTAAEETPRYPAVTFQDPAVLAKARDGWERLKGGISVPRLWLPEGATI